MESYITGCPRDCYSTCTMRVVVKDGRIRSFEPFAGNNATPEGPCLKGLSYVERVYSPERITKPLLKKSSGDFVPVDWDEALSLIAEKIRSVRDSFGMQSVLFLPGTGTKGILNRVSLDFWELAGGCTTTYGDLCWPAGLEATRLTLGDNKHSAPWDIVNSKLIILWGKNPAETNIHQVPFLQRAKENGAVIVVIDPRRTQSAERADLLIQPKPGTDGAIALAVANVLITNNHIDKEFLDKAVLGFDAFKDLALQMTPARAAEISNIPEEYILRLAGLLGTIKPALINTGYGMQRYTNSGQTIRSLIALLAITGNIGKSGSGWMYANLQSHLFGAKDPLAIYPDNSESSNIRTAVSITRLAEDIHALRNPPVNMLWVERANPVSQNPNTASVKAAFKAMDFIVVVDQFLTDTAAMADIVLPAKSMFEQTDVINAYWHPYIQIKQKVIEPVGEVKPETEIYYLLAKRLGFSEQQIAEIIPEPSDMAVEAYLNKAIGKHGLSLEQLRNGPVLPPGHQETAFEDLTFPTPSGKIELYSEECKKRWGLPPLPEYRAAAEAAAEDKNNKYPILLLTPNTKNRIHSQFKLELTKILSPPPAVYLSPSDAAKRSIKKGSQVRVYNARGSLTIEAKIDLSLRSGCTYIYNGWWAGEGGGVNILSEARETDMGFGAAFHDNRVEIERAD